MKKFGKQAFALFLCLVMCLSMLSAAAFAEEETEAALPEESAVADEAAETTLPDAGELPADAEAPAAPAEPVEPDTDAASTSEEDGENAAPAPEEDQPDEAAEARPVLVRFALTPEDAELILYTKDEQGEKQEIEPEEDGSYRLLPGLYFYTVACEGFAPVEETELRIEPAAEPLDVDVTLESATEVSSPEVSSPETTSSEPKEAANAVVASGTCGENLTWTLDDEGTLTISGTGEMTDYSSWGSDTSPWYSEKEDIKTLVVESGVTQIGEYAFYKCSNLSSIYLSTSYSDCGNQAFGDCAAITDIYYEGTIRQWDNVYFYSSSRPLIHCLDADGVTPISFLFGGVCGENLTWTLDMEGTLTISGTGPMDDYDYYDVTPWSEFSLDDDRVRKVTIQSGVTSIGASAFGNCTALESITIPDSVTSIGGGAFADCYELTSVTLPENMTSVSYGTFSGCSSLCSVKLPAKLREIGESAFSGCGSLDSIDIPNGVRTIGNDAFAHSGLVSIVIPDSVRDSLNCFRSCADLAEVKLSNSLRWVGGFEDCVSLKSITIPESAEIVGDFTGCTSLTSITIPDKVYSLGSFEGCTSLKSIKLPNHQVTITRAEFKNCTSLSNVSLSSNIYKIETEAFMGCSSLKTILVPGQVETIADSAFEECTALTSISLPLSVTDIGYYAFNDCPNLKTVNYAGTRSAWNQISIGGRNEPLTRAALSFAGYKLQTPIIYASIQSETNGKPYVALDWYIDGLSASAVSNYRYRVYRKTTESASWTAIATTTGSVCYYDKNISWGNTYIYTVRVVDSSGKIVSDFDQNGKTVKAYLRMPLLESAVNAATGVKVTWDKVYGAEKYRVFRKVPGGSWAKVGDTTALTLTDTKAVSGTEYIYTVRCLSSDAKKYTSNFDPIGIAVTYIAAPALPAAAATTEGVLVKWTAVDGAESYRVFRKLSGGSWAKLADTTEPSFEDKTVESGKTYVYTIRCMDAGRTVYTSAYNTTGRSILYVAAPKLAAAANTATGVKVSWAKSAGAAKYRVFRKTADSGWTKVGDTTALTLTDTKAVSGTEYTYTVRCLSSDAKKYTSAFDPSGIAVTFIATPALPAVSSAVGGIQVKWTAVDGAEKYRVFRKVSGGSWTKVDDTTETSFLDREDDPNGPVSGKTYVYTIRCITADGSAYTSAYNTTGKSLAYIAVPEVSGITLGSNGVTLKWSKVGGAAKYRIFRKTEGGSWAKLADTTAVSYTDKTGSAAYIYTVRCISSDGTKYTSGFNANGWRVSQS